MKISSREREIIKLLLKAETDITVNTIATELEVSVRTIHRDLKGIEKLLSTYNLALMKKSGVGLHINGNEADKKKFHQTLSNVTVFDFSPEERRTIILATLLEMNEPLKLFTLANELKVTEATISLDLDQLEQDLAMFHLTLTRKRGYGIEIVGNETNKRAALSDLIAKYIDPFEFVSLIKKNIQKESTHQLNTISNRLLDFINPERLSIIESVVEDARVELPYGLADSAHIGLVVHLALAIERLHKGEAIKFDQSFMQQIEKTKEFAIAKKMLQKLEIKLNTSIPEDEIGYITMHLMGAKVRVDQDYLIEESSIDIAFQAKSLIQFVSTGVSVDLASKSGLLHDLVAHLKPAIYRLQQNMRIVNPLIKNIKKDYNDLFHLIQEGVLETFPDMDFPEDEIGYLVLHFASALLSDTKVDLHALVICSTGIGTAKMLSTKLMQKIPEINHVDNQSFFDLKHLDLDTYDLIVSTIPLNDFGRKYIQTSPMLTNDEIHQIKKLVNQKKLTFHTGRKIEPFNRENMDNGDIITELEALNHYSQAILNLLRSLHVQEINDKRSLESILYEASMRLEMEKKISNKNNVVKKLLEREKLSGLGIPGTSAALYHARSIEINEPTLSIYKLVHPLHVPGMDNEKMAISTILLMLAPEKVQQEVLEVFSFLSSLLVQDEKSIQLFSTGEKEKVKDYLSVQFRKFLLEKKLL
ncbi:BglG family transcription antiterminator [Paucisalibacillus globulus]|uniref:BglG family transcription antiterminator n=1 Tax=Paucisalibacillus globulus TaxID=351095 RepID=UPI00042183BB|nr:BglG family transcription antiterminator [Paucisalibacillus globulus]